MIPKIQILFFGNGTRLLKILTTITIFLVV